MKTFINIILCLFLATSLLSQTQLGSDLVGEASNDRFGSSVALSDDGNRVAVCAPNNDDNGTDAGQVRIFDYLNNTWTQVGNDIDGDAAGDNFGSSIAMCSNGNRIIVGAADYIHNGSHYGYVKILEENNGSWTQIGNNIDGEDSNDMFGGSVAISADGQRVAIGASYNDENGHRSGHVKIYEETNGVWTQIGNNIMGDAAQALFGTSISLASNGQILAIGSPGGNGKVKIFEESGGVWNQLGSDIEESDPGLFGYSIALSSSGARVAIGNYTSWGPGLDPDPDGLGHFSVYELNNGSWTLVGNRIYGDANFEGLGVSIAISSDGKRVAVGSFDTREVKIYKETFGNWIQLGTEIQVGGFIPGKLIGLSGLGHRVAVGAPMIDIAKVYGGTALQNIQIPGNHGVPTLSLIQMSATPNPTTGVFSVQYKIASGFYRLAIYSPSGNLIRSTTISGPGNGYSKFNISNYEPGVYVARIFNQIDSKQISIVLVSN